MRKIRLTENQLHNVIKESVKRCLNEMDYSDLYRLDKKWQNDESWEEFDKEKSKLNSNKMTDNIMSQYLYGNSNIYSRNGRDAMLSMSDDPVEREFGQRQRTTGYEEEHIPNPLEVDARERYAKRCDQQMKALALAKRRAKADGIEHPSDADLEKYMDQEY